MKLRIRAFKAVDDLRACQTYVKGHMEVLRRYGITMITSANIEWFVNPNVIVIAAESPDGKEMYGGMRIHLHGGTQDLPIEDAVGKLDYSIYKIVKEHAKLGTGEFCGMWNSREVSGMGVSYVLTSAAVALISQLQTNSFFVLCAEYTVHMVSRVGFRVLKEIGNQGAFYYPKLDLIATALVKYYDDFTTADKEETDLIMNLRKSPAQTCTVLPYKKEVPFQVEFELDLTPLKLKIVKDIA